MRTYNRSYNSLVDLLAIKRRKKKLNKRVEELIIINIKFKWDISNIFNGQRKILYTVLT